MNVIVIILGVLLAGTVSIGMIGVGQKSYEDNLHDYEMKRDQNQQK